MMMTAVSAASAAVAEGVPHCANLAAALDEWSKSIGSEYVRASPDVCQLYGRSTSPWRRKPLAVLLPGSVREVQDVVRIARRYGCPLYPISGGKNWGLGDACPTTGNQVVVDLKRLNAIREINAELGYAVIEAGVTQRQLFDRLARDVPDLVLDATGAGPNATIVGNVMERGYGHSPCGDRYHNSCNYEVILADGQLLRTGFGQFENATAAHLLKAGLGPSLDGLFTQANLGIVTAMTVWLMPKPARLEAFAFTVKHDDALPSIIDALRPLRLNGVLPSTIHIANDLRLISSKTQYPWDLTAGATPLSDGDRLRLRATYGVGAWNVLGGLYGTPGMVRGARCELRRALRGVATPRFINTRRLSWANRLAHFARSLGLGHAFSQRLESINSAFALLNGEPVAEHLRGAAWRTRGTLDGKPSDPLERGDGLVWLSPTLPMTGRDAERVKTLAERVFQSYGFDSLVTFVSISGRAMCAPLTICYDAASPREKAKAATCYEELSATMVSNGYYPYRLGMQSMSLASSGMHVHAETTRCIKAQFDPWGVLAPGRYIASEASQELR